MAESVEFSMASRAMSEASDALGLLEAKVHKLKWLVEDMWFWLYCKNVYQKSDKEQAVIIGGIIARMGELGIEPKFTEEDE